MEETPIEIHDKEEQENLEELPMDEAQQEHHDLLEICEREANKKLEEVEQDKWYEESEKEESSSYY